MARTDPAGGSVAAGLFAEQHEVVAGVPEHHHRLLAVRGHDGRQIGALAQRLQPPIQIEQLEVVFREALAEQVLRRGRHVAPPQYWGRRSCSRLAFNSKRGSSPVLACSTLKRSPSCASARSLPSCACSRGQQSCWSGFSSTFTVISSCTLSTRVITIWNSSTSLNSRTTASTARG